MIIESVTLENFRQFKDKHQITFSIDDAVNVTVVMGENGAGKTTLEQSFTWCLYGVNTFQDKELVNREIRNAMPIGDSVKVEVELIVQSQMRRYRIRRRQIVTKKNTNKCRPSGEDFRVMLQNENGDWEEVPKSVQARATVEEMLPQKLSSFFFFDGERIDSMSKDLLHRHCSEDFENAVRALVGLDVLEATKDRFGPDTFKRTVTGSLFSEIKGEDGDKISEISDKIDTLQQDIINLDKNEKDYNKELKRIQEKLDGYKLEISKMQDSINNGTKYIQIQSKINAEEQKKEKDEATTLKYFSKNIYQILLQPLLLKAIQEIPQKHKLNLGIPHIHAKTIEYLLKKEKCICGTDLHGNTDCIKTLEILMHELPPYSLNTMLADFTKDIKFNAHEAGDKSKTLIKYAEDALGHDENISEYANDLKLLEKQLPDKDRLASLRKNKNEAEVLIGRLRQKCYATHNEIGSKTSEMDRWKRQRDSITSTNKRNRINNLYYRYALAVYNDLENDYRKKEKHTRETLEFIINEIFSNIYNGKIGISINDDYSVKTYLYGNESDDDLEKNTAQSYAVIFAFITSIIKMHFEDKKKKNNGQLNKDDGLPLVMDAPLSAFDKDRIKRICEELPQIAKQVIIFIKDTDGDIAEEYMKDVIGKKWLIQADSQTSSKIIERN